MNIRLIEVLSDMMGATRQGHRAPSWAECATPSAWPITTSGDPRPAKLRLPGRWRLTGARSTLEVVRAKFDDIGRHSADCDANLDAMLDERSQANVDIDKLPRAGSRAQTEYDICQWVTNWVGADLRRIDGLRLTQVMKLLTAIGPDVGRFINVRYVCSWLGLCRSTESHAPRIHWIAAEDVTVEPGLALRHVLGRMSEHGQASRQTGCGPQAELHGQLHTYA